MSEKAILPWRRKSLQTISYSSKMGFLLFSLNEPNIRLFHSRSRRTSSILETTVKACEPCQLEDRIVVFLVQFVTPERGGRFHAFMHFTFSILKTSHMRLETNCLGEFHDILKKKKTSGDDKGDYQFQADVNRPSMQEPASQKLSAPVIANMQNVCLCPSSNDNHCTDAVLVVYST